MIIAIADEKTIRVASGIAGQLLKSCIILNPQKIELTLGTKRNTCIL